MTPRPLFDRFNAKVDRRGPNDCWPWTGNRCGIHAAGQGSPLVKPQRIAWMQEYGSIPDPGTPIGRLRGCLSTCCNPAHLTYGTYTVLHPNGAGPNGHRNGQAKVTEDDVQVIRSRCAAGERQRAVAADFGITQSNVSHICGLRTWRDIP